MPDARVMALLTSCMCCSLLVGSILAALYTAMVYLVAFILSLWWILEAEGGVSSGGTVPVPAYLLCLGYFLLATTSLWMLYGLYKKRKRALLVWVFVMTLFCFPEMGMVTFMAFVHWKLSTAYGVADLVFYVFRAAFNLLSVLCVQSQYSRWRDEMVNSQMLKRLEHLHVGCVRSGEGRCSESSTAYQNPAFVPLQDDPSSSFHRSYFRASVVRGLAAASVGQPPTTTPDRDAPLTRTSDKRGPDAGLGYLPPSITPGWDAYLAKDSQSEFNAAMFSPASMGFLPLVSGVSRSEAALAVLPAGGHSPHPYTGPNYFCTQSLDRRRYLRPAPEVGSAVRPSTRESHSSIGAASDDLGEYRDVAL